MLKFLKDKASPATVDAFAELLVQVFAANKQNSRVVLPGFAALDLLFSNDAFAPLQNFEAMLKLLALVEAEMAKTKDAKKLLAAISVFCGFLSFEGEVRHRALTVITLLLVSTFPKVRKETAQQLYVSLLALEGVLKEEHQEEAESILVDTQW